MESQLQDLAWNASLAAMQELQNEAAGAPAVTLLTLLGGFCVWCACVVSRRSSRQRRALPAISRLAAPTHVYEATRAVDEDDMSIVSGFVDAISDEDEDEDDALGYEYDERYEDEPYYDEQRPRRAGRGGPGVDRGGPRWDAPPPAPRTLGRRSGRAPFEAASSGRRLAAAAVPPAVVIAWRRRMLKAPEPSATSGRREPAPTARDTGPGRSGLYGRK